MRHHPLFPQDHPAEIVYFSVNASTVVQQRLATSDRNHTRKNAQMHLKALGRLGKALVTGILDDLLSIDRYYS